MTKPWDSTLWLLVPGRVKRLVQGTSLYIRHRSSSLNIYHCCVQKTASQWTHGILSDPRILRYSGLVPHHYGKTFYGDFDVVKQEPTKFTDSLPPGTIVSPIYVDFENYTTIPKPECFKTFFVTRDPRDIVVSWYFSVKYSHKIVGRIAEHRQILNTISIPEGISYSVDYLCEYGIFAALRSWADAPAKDPNVLVVRFEDITAPNNSVVFKALFSHCDIQIPDEELSHLLQDHSFKKLSGRKQGEEDQQSHYRKGVSGDWRNHFDTTITGKFKATANDLVVQLGYEADSNW